MTGKGSTPRPIPDREQYARNWDAIRWGTIQDFVNADGEEKQRIGDELAKRVDAVMDAKEREYGIK